MVLVVVVVVVAVVGEAAEYKYERIGTSSRM